MNRFGKHIALLLALSLCVAPLLGMPLLGLTGCGFEEEDAVAPEPQYESPYNWENLTHEEGRYYYYKDGELASLTGIDVSSHQKVIDWQAVASDGIDFAYIRVGNRGATEGGIYLDEQYYANIEGAVAAGIPIGIYFFSQAINDAEAMEEAEFVLEHIAGLELQYPVVFDHEPVTINGEAGRANNVPHDMMTRIAQRFCDRIELAGYPSMIYGNKKDIARFGSEIIENSKIWFAEYEHPIPTGQFDFIMWQYSSRGTVAGIETYVDMNIHFLEP